MSAQTFWPPFEGCIDVALVLVSVTALMFCYFLYTIFVGKESWEKYGVKHINVLLNVGQHVEKLFQSGLNTAGLSLGSRMILVTRDVRLLREIMVKRFNSFPDRIDSIRTRTHLGQGLVFLRGGRWKRMRHIMSSAFSTSKMKQISPYIYSTARKLAMVFEAYAKDGRLIEVKHTLGQYTTGIIAKTGFGLTTDCLGEPDNEFTRHCKTIMKSSATGWFAKLLQTIVFRLPSLNKFVIEVLKVDFFDNVNIETDKYFNEILRLPIRERIEIEKTQKRKPGDFLQNLIAAHVAEDGPNEASNSKKITEADVISQSLLILFAAFDTTASTLQFCFLLLAMHPHVQDRVYKEIEEVVSPSDDVIDEEEGSGGSDTTWGPTPSLDQLQRLSYTQQVIEETLRLYPPIPSISRSSYHKTTISLGPDSVNSRSPGGRHQIPGHPPSDAAPGETNLGRDEADRGLLRKRSGQTTSASENTPRRTSVAAETITIPAGASVLIPIAKIHKDPRHYPDPEKFDPDRFLPKNKAARDPFSFMPFGFGPRQCIGMRMAYLEIKTALVYVLRRVRLEVNDLTEPQAGGNISLSLIGGITVNLLKPIKLAVRLR